MRPLYFLLYITVNFSLRVFYKGTLVINRPKKRKSSTIYVSNHANSFMDPLVIGSFNYAVVQFMTRSDVFKWWLKPVLWGANMLPIFRQHDGADTKSANSASFNKVNESLKNGGNILIFGEGFTDDIPIRSLKPVKKGALRMGFQALEYCNWEKEIFVAPMGVSYSDRHAIGSDIVICNHQPILLNTYKEQYLSQPSRTINELTKVVEKNMQECVIYVADKNWTDFLEQVMMLTAKGYNNETRNNALPLEQRWLYGKNIASWLNNSNPHENEDLLKLKADTNSYFALLRRMKIPAGLVPDSEKSISRGKELAFLLLLCPVCIPGILHGAVPYLVAKKLTEKMFRRRVFWGSVKMMLAKLVGAVWNIPLIVGLSYAFGIPAWAATLYFFACPVFFLVAYRWMENLKRWLAKGKLMKVDLSAIIRRKEELKARIRLLIPVA